MLLTIAGFDPSSGAGLTRDLLVFDHYGLEGLSVCTAITVQNEIDFKSVEWVSEALIIQQVNILFDLYEIEYVKIGLIENMDVLQTIIEQLRSLNKEIKIIWDPILSASAGFNFHDDLKLSSSFIDQFYLVTPNLEEAINLQIIDSDKNVLIKPQHAHILIKTFHENKSQVEDLLIGIDQEKVFSINKIKGASIHGSGCRISSAILANLFLNSTLDKSIKEGKNYLSKKISKKI